jgi:hypothetical protein
MALSFDRLVSPDLVAAIGPSPLRRLISAVAPSLVAPVASPGDDASDLAEWLREVPPEAHQELFERLHSIAHLLEQDDLQHTLADKGLAVGDGRPLGEILVDLTLSALETVESLSAQASVAEAHHAKVFVTYRRPGAAIKLPKVLPATLRAIERACQVELERSGHGRYCRVWASADGDCVALVIAYAAALQSKRVISRVDSAELHTNRAPRDAVVLITPDTRELRVSAGSSRERAFLVAAISPIICGDGPAFHNANAFDLDVICKASFARTLRKLSGADFGSASLVELVLIHRDALRTRIALHASDVLELAKEQGLELDRFEPKRAVFAFVPADGRRRWKITIKGADSKKCTAPWSEQTIQSILKELGILRPTK